MMSEQQPQEGPSQEELEKRSKELNAFYKKELPLLRLRTEYEELLTKIDVAKMTRIEIMMAKAQMMEGQENQPPQNQRPETQENTEHVRPVNKSKASKVIKPKGKRELKKVK